VEAFEAPRSERKATYYRPARRNLQTIQAPSEFISNLLGFRDLFGRNGRRQGVAVDHRLDAIFKLAASDSPSLVPPTAVRGTTAPMTAGESTESGVEQHR
jgi:hypothetical protein